MKINEILMESINDKSLFKAVFMAGAPGSGKSYVLKQITDGSIPTKIVNTDDQYEKVAAIRGVDLSTENNKIAQRFVAKEAKTLTKAKLTQYINSMLPLFVDSTSNNKRTTMLRMQLLEAIGYDISMVWVRTSLETALSRAATRDRRVDPEFIKASHEDSEKNMAFFKSKLGSNFFIIDNDEGELTDEVIIKSYKKASKFFKGELENPIGVESRDKLIGSGDKYLSDSIGMEVIQKSVDKWYNLK